MKKEKNMRKGLLFVTGLVLASFLLSTPVSARKWNNPENERRYKAALKNQSEAHRNESKAWQNYDRELGRAQDDVRRVRNDAIKGAVTGGPAGAAWGAAKGAGKGIAYRVNDYRRNR
jgi:hypothetical protein